MNGDVVAVDVGNSAIKLALRHPSSTHAAHPPQTHSVPLDQPQWDQTAIDWVDAQLGGRRPLWRIAGVHRSAADRLSAAIISRDAESEVHRITRHDVPMPVAVDQPDRLGIDRLVGAHAAAERVGAPLVVVDAGSAVTVDWVDAEGRFQGGAILPGPALQFSALARGTDALPQIDLGCQEELSIPGRNTVDAIRLGVLAGIAAGIERLALSYAERAQVSAESCPLVLTGGDSTAISRLLGRSHQVIENLVCCGLLDLPRSSPAATNQRDELE